MPTVVRDGRVVAVSDLKDVGGTDPVVLYTCMPPYSKYVLRKLVIYNPDSSDHEVILGEHDTTANSWSKDKLVVKVLAGQFVALGPDDLPSDYVMTTDPSTAILAWAAKLDAAVTAKKVKVKAEFEVL